MMETIPQIIKNCYIPANLIASPELSIETRKHIDPENRGVQVFAGYSASDDRNVCLEIHTMGVRGSGVDHVEFKGIVPEELRETITETIARVACGDWTNFSPELIAARDARRSFARSRHPFSKLTHHEAHRSRQANLCSYETLMAFMEKKRLLTADQ